MEAEKALARSRGEQLNDWGCTEVITLHCLFLL
jgi:hypothetical protein